MTTKPTKRIEYFTDQVDFTRTEMNDGRQSVMLSRMTHAGGPDAPQIQEVKMPPDFAWPVHAHLEDEIVYIVSGEMILGRNSYKTGDSVYVPGQTLYTFKSGPQGLHYLNFRPRADRTNFKRDEFETLQTLQGAAREAFIGENIEKMRRQRAD